MVFGGPVEVLQRCQAGRSIPRHPTNRPNASVETGSFEVAISTQPLYPTQYRADSGMFVSCMESQR